MDYEGVIEEGCDTLRVKYQEDPAVDLRNLNARITELCGSPLITAQYSTTQLEALEKINGEFLAEYTQKRQNMLNRFDNYMKLVNGNSRVPKDVIRDVFEVRNSLSPIPKNHLDDITKPSTNSSLIFSSLEKTSPLNISSLDEKTLASGIFPLRFAPTKPPKSNGKKKKEELKAKRLENPKPVPKREKNMKKREKAQNNQDKPEELSLAQRKANKADKKKQKREAKKRNPKNQPKGQDQQDEEHEDKPTEEPKDENEQGEENADEKEHENEEEHEEEDEESVSHRSEGEFLDSAHSDEEN